MSKEMINKLELRELTHDDQIKACITHSINTLKDLLTTKYTRTTWENPSFPEGESIVYAESIKEKIEELKITLTNYK